MKLYFYFLEKPYKGEPYIREDECEVDEKPKTYKAVDKFPKGYYHSTVRKEDIGCGIGYDRNIVAFTEKSREKAATFFREKFEGCITDSRSRIRREENNILKYENLLKMVEEWKQENE